MSRLLKLAAVVLSVACLAGRASSSRDLPPFRPHPDSVEARLAAGLAGGGLGECWSALLELRSCTNEIVLFFLNGESYLGLDCCRAIRVITRQCWPSMLTSIGFTSQEGDILRGYCDAEAAPPAPDSALPPQSHPPALAPSADAGGPVF